MLYVCFLSFFSDRLLHRRLWQFNQALQGPISAPKSTKKVELRQQEKEAKATSSQARIVFPSHFDIPSSHAC